ncbi:MAG: SMC-Scp complex subunit ScpB [Patescibacteria group bacterium]
MLDIASQIEAILFYKGEPVPHKELAQILAISIDEVQRGLDTLKIRLNDRGLSLILKDDEALLATAPAMSDRLEKLTKEELERDLGKAGMETLTIIAYHGPVTRAQIDHIRGVNSTFSVRQLMIRGLIERTENPKDMRAFLYRPTFELLSYMGLSTLRELPDYANVRSTLDAFEKESIANESHATGQPSDSTGTTNN